MAVVAASLCGCHLIAGYDGLTLREDPELLRSARYGDDHSDVARALAVDGDIALVGDYQGQIDFGGGLQTAGASHAVFATLLAADGSHLWTRSFSATSSAHPAALSVRAVTLTATHMVIAGSFGGALELDEFALSSVGQEAIFLGRLRRDDGTVEFASAYGDSELNLLGTKLSLTSDGTGATILTGGFTGEIDMGCGDYNSEGQIDAFVSKFDSTGACEWTARWGDTNLQAAEDAATDIGGNVLVAGEFAGKLEFGNGGQLDSSGGIDIFVTKLTPDGQHIWSRRFGNNTGLQGSARLAAHGLGNVMVSGYFEGTVNFGGGPLHADGSGHDLFLAKFDPNGNHLWSRQFPLTRASCDPTACTLDEGEIAVDGAGNIVWVGHFEGDIDFGGTQRSSLGETDLFIAKFDPEGELLWSGRYGDAEAQCAVGSCIALVGTVGTNIVASGYFDGSLDFDDETRSSAGEHDVFLATFGP